jgi:hypothetical protein
MTTLSILWIIKSNEMYEEVIVYGLFGGIVNI